MENKDESAFPFEGGNNNGIQPSSGLTKREYFAGLAMQGILAYGGYATPHDMASDAVMYADALLAELEKEA